MIESIKLQNYKAFEDVTIPIKPLTIFVGANSVGKSSIIQMLMLLHQTAEEVNANYYTSAFKIYGKYVNVGNFENLLTNKQRSRTLVLSIDISSDDLKSEIENGKTEFVNNFKRAAGAFVKSNLVKDIYNKDLSSRNDFKEYITHFVSAIKENVQDDKHLISFLQYRLGMKFDITNDNSIEDIMRCYDLLSELSKCTGSIYSLQFHMQVEGDYLRIKRIVCTIDGKYTLLDVEGKTDSNIKVFSDYCLNHKDCENISRYVNFKNTIFDLLYYLDDETELESTLVSSYINKYVVDVLDELRDDLMDYKINYVSPLRAHPKRYYMLDKAKMSISLDTLDGDAIAEVLKENREVRQSVNEWFSKFDFKIDVNAFREVIHHMNVTQNGLSLDITDVGFGISQVLPIIIQGFLSSPDSLTIIEQPEIHLHPKMQADLGDLFIDIVKKNNKRLIIETHSEYILRRIRRRISEGKMDNKDVAICLFHPRSKDASGWVELLEVGEKGGFNWPEDFYGGELYNDTIEFLKNQQ